MRQLKANYVKWSNEGLNAKCLAAQYFKAQQLNWSPSLSAALPIYLLRVNISGQMLLSYVLPCRVQFAAFVGFAAFRQRICFVTLSPLAGCSYRLAFAQWNWLAPLAITYVQCSRSVHAMPATHFSCPVLCHAAFVFFCSFAAKLSCFCCNFNLFYGQCWVLPPWPDNFSNEPNTEFGSCLRLSCRMHHNKHT